MDEKGLADRIIKDTGMTLEETRTLSIEEQHRRLSKHTGKTFPLPISGDISYITFHGEVIPLTYCQ